MPKSIKPNVNIVSLDGSGADYLVALPFLVSPTGLIDHFRSAMLFAMCSITSSSNSNPEFR